MSLSPAVSPRAPADAAATGHFSHPVRVYWEDTDAGGIVFYGNYLKFMERARTEWLSSLGFEQEGMRRSGEGMFIVADTQLRFLRPARLDDRLTVTVAISDIGRASVAFQQDVWRGDTLLTQGQVRIGWVVRTNAKASQTTGDAGREGRQEDDALKPGRIPEPILAVLRAQRPARHDTQGACEPTPRARAPQPTQAAPAATPQQAPGG